MRKSFHSKFQKLTFSQKGHREEFHMKFQFSDFCQKGKGGRAGQLDSLRFCARPTVNNQAV